MCPVPEEADFKAVGGVGVLASLVAMYLPIMAIAHWHWKNFDWEQVPATNIESSSVPQMFVDQQIQQTRLGKINPSADYLLGLMEGKNISFPLTIGHGDDEKTFHGSQTLSLYIKESASQQLVSVDDGSVISR